MEDRRELLKGLPPQEVAECFCCIPILTIPVQITSITRCGFRSLFIANAQPPELIQPSEGPFDHPSPSPQSAAMLGVALRKKKDDASVTQTLPD